MSIANELITRGWTQGRLYGHDGSACLVGALNSACRDNEDFAAAWAFLESRVGIIANWNDDPCRTFDEVLRVAKEADEFLDAETA